VRLVKRLGSVVAAVVLAATLGAWLAASSQPHVHQRPTGPTDCALCVVRHGGAVAPTPVPPPLADRAPIARPISIELAPVFPLRFDVPESRGPPA